MQSTVPHLGKASPGVMRWTRLGHPLGRARPIVVDTGSPVSSRSRYPVITCASSSRVPPSALGVEELSPRVQEVPRSHTDELTSTAPPPTFSPAPRTGCIRNVPRRFARVASIQSPGSSSTVTAQTPSIPRSQGAARAEPVALQAPPTRRVSGLPARHRRRATRPGPPPSWISATTASISSAMRSSEATAGPSRSTVRSSPGRFRSSLRSRAPLPLLAGSSHSPHDRRLAPGDALRSGQRDHLL